jgi:hypothetical protein
MSVIPHGLPNPGGKGALGGRQLEGEKELINPVEVAAQGRHLMDDILETDDLPSEVLLHLRIGLDLHPLLSHLPEELLVDQLADQLLGRLSPGDVVLHPTQLSDVSGGPPDEDSGVDATEVELVQDDFLLLGDISHSADSDNQEEFSDPRCMGGDGDAIGQSLCEFVLCKWMPYLESVVGVGLLLGAVLLDELLGGLEGLLALLPLLAQRLLATQLVVQRRLVLLPLPHDVRQDVLLSGVGGEVRDLGVHC